MIYGVPPWIGNFHIPHVIPHVTPFRGHGLGWMPRSLTPECQRRPVNFARLKRAQLGNKKDLWRVPHGAPRSNGQIWRRSLDSFRCFEYDGHNPGDTVVYDYIYIGVWWYENMIENWVFGCRDRWYHEINNGIVGILTETRLGMAMIQLDFIIPNPPTGGP